MKILVLSTKIPYPPKDGGAIATLNLSLGLAASGCEVTMLTLNTVKHYFPPDNIPSNIRDRITIKAVNIDTSFRLFAALRNLIFTRKPYISDRFISSDFEAELITLLDTNPFDIVQIEGPYLAYYLPIIRNKSDAKISFRAHNIEHEIWKRKAKNEYGIIPRNYLNILAKRIRKLETELLNRIDMVIPISDRDKDQLIKIKPGVPYLTVPTGINIADYPLKNVVTKNSIFFLGSLDWLPNQEGLLWFKKQVIPHITDASLHPVLHFAGRNATPEFLKEVKDDALVYHGEVEDARAFMERYNIMAVPLLTGSGIRIKILEGMAMGKCVVTTSIGAEGIPVTEGENILIANEGKLFANHLEKLLSDDDLCKKIGNNARRFIQENFDNFAISSRLKDFYKQQT